MTLVRGVSGWGGGWGAVVCSRRAGVGEGVRRDGDSEVW